MKNRKWLLAGWLGATALGGLAFAASQQLYVQTPNAKIYDKPGGEGQGDALKLGDTVEWMGASKTKGWHNVKHGAQTGVMFGANLNSHPPTAELTVGSGAGAQAAAGVGQDSGAASKAMTEGALKYGKAINQEEAIKEVLTAEAVSYQTKPEQIGLHAKHSGLPVSDISGVKP